MCLEIYLVQSVLFTDKMNKIFPANIIIMFIIIIIMAYILRCTSRVFAQTLRDGDYNWKEVVKVYEESILHLSYMYNHKTSQPRVGG